MSWLALLDANAMQEIEQTTKEVTSFFSLNNLKNMFNSLCNWSVSLVGKIIIALVIWFIGKKIINVCIKVVKKMLGRGTLEQGVISFAISVLRFVLYAVLVMIVVDKLGIQTTSLITLFGSAALAVGMSLQGSLSNFAGGVLILIFKPFKVGDYIVANGQEGTVSSIELLYTRLHTIDNKIIMMPNGTLSNSSIVNVGAENERRLDIEISVGYNSDLKKAKELLTQILDEEKAIIKEKDINVIVKSLDESCVTIETRAWVKHENYWNTRFELLERYKEVFDANGMEIPFNQLDVHITQ